MKGEQDYLPADGMEPPRNRDIEKAIDAWLEAKSEHRRAGETTKKRHESLLARMSDAGIDRYPFTDPDTKKKCIVVATKEPKAKVMRGNRARFDKDPNKKRKVKNGENEVESRRVARTEEHDKIADPFSSTRSKLKS